MVDYKVVETLTPAEREAMTRFEKDNKLPPTYTIEIEDGRRFTGTMKSIRYLFKSSDRPAIAWRDQMGIEYWDDGEPS